MNSKILLSHNKIYHIYATQPHPLHTKNAVAGSVMVNYEQGINIFLGSRKYLLISGKKK